MPMKISKLIQALEAIKKYGDDFFIKDIYIYDYSIQLKPASSEEKDIKYSIVYASDDKLIIEESKIVLDG